MKRLAAWLLFAAMLFSSFPALSESATAELAEMYAQGELLLANKKYSEAAAQFENLGAYADASQMAMYCKALMAAEDLQLYDMAVQAFQGLGEFRDSQQLVTYYQAREYEAVGDTIQLETDSNFTLQTGVVAYQNAEELFSSLALFKDSLTRYSHCQEQKNALSSELARRNAVRQEETYQQALALENDGKYQEAINLYKTIESYQDSKERIIACENGIKEGVYQQALALEKGSQYQEAIDLYKAIQSYQDSQDRIIDCENKIKEGIYQQAKTTALQLISEGAFTKAKTILKAYVNQPDLKTLYDLCLFRTASTIWGSPSASGSVWYAHEIDGTRYFSLLTSTGELLVENVDGIEMTYYDEYGKRLTSVKYNTGYDKYSVGSLNFYNGYKYALAYRSDKAVLVDQMGEERVLSTKYNYANVAGNTLLCYRDKITGLYGCTDLNGKVVIKPEYDFNIWASPNGYIFAEKKVNNKNTKDYYTDKGVKLATSKYDLCKPLSGTMAVVGKKDGKSNRYQIGIINWSGKVLLKIGTYSCSKEEFNRITQSGKYILMCNKGKMGILDLKFKKVVDFKYNYIQRVIRGKIFVVSNKDNNAFQFYHFDGKLLNKDRKYTNYYADETSGSIAALGKDGWYILDLNGKVTY